MALRALYLVDVRGPTAQADAQAFLGAATDESDVLRFAEQLFDGCTAHRGRLDREIAAVAENWQIRRMPVIDRNILRLGTYELIYLDDIPVKVSINEAIDLAKRYSTAESGAFVNGVLDKIRTIVEPERP